MILIVDQAGSTCNLDHMLHISIMQGQNKWQLRLYTNQVIGDSAHDYCVLWQSEDRVVIEDKLAALTSYLAMHCTANRLVIRMNQMTMANRTSQL
jgi:hypothetical protein